jgi:hypothetical protein
MSTSLSLGAIDFASPSPFLPPPQLPLGFELLLNTNHDCSNPQDPHTSPCPSISSDCSNCLEKHIRGFVAIMCLNNWLIVLVFSGLTWVAYATASSPASAIFSRGIVSPSNAELLHNSIGFGVPAFLCFLLRM